MKYITFDEPETLSADEFFMKEALKEAQKAAEADEVPIGAVVVHQGRIIARGHNLTERLQDVTAHAEMQALTSAANYIGAKYLPQCTLYVTIEPCVMCAGASYWTQIGRIVYGASDPKRGYSNFHQKILHPKTEVLKGLLAETCGSLVQSFFRNKR
jgi:tRNA(adenine34) deaminase